MRIRFLAAAFVMAATLQAATYSTLQASLKQLLPAGQKAFKAKFVATEAQAKALNAFGEGDYMEGDEFDVYYTKDAQGKVSCTAVQLEEMLAKWKSSHTWVIGIAADGKLTGVSILELTDKYTFPLAQANYLKQFPGKPAAQLAVGKGMDAVAGASESAVLLSASIRRAAYIASQAKLP